jgi:hypothetical protein
MINLSIYEQLQNVDKEKTKAKKIALLREYAQNASMKIILDLTFNPKIKWLLPEGVPPYSPSAKEADVHHVLKSDARRLQYFINTKEGSAMKPLRRETMYIEMLESVDRFDAKLLIAIKDKKMPFKTVTKKLVQEALPQETKGW